MVSFPHIPPKGCYPLDEVIGYEPFTGIASGKAAYTNADGTAAGTAAECISENRMGTEKADPPFFDLQNGGFL